MGGGCALIQIRSSFSCAIDARRKNTGKAITAQIVDAAWTDNERKVHIRMIKENGKIKEISENEAFCMFVDNEYYMAMDFYEFKNRLEEAGAKITKN